MPSRLDVAVIGAGPYGLSLAAHLTDRRVEHRIFGHPMLPWSRMHAGMGLKSPDFGTNIYAPSGGYGFVEWCRRNGISTAEPIAIDLFTEYGLWAQQQLVPHVEQVDVTDLRRHDSGFLITLASSEQVRARRVVVATGLSHFQRMPAEVRNLPPALVSHTTQHRTYSEFSGLSVAVLGGGASALEASAMLHEAGADVRVLVRGGYVYLGGPKPGRRSLRDRIMNPSSVLGPGRRNAFLQRVPMAVHYFPRDRRVRLVRTYLGPAAGWWLRGRVEGRVQIETGTTVLAAEPSSSGVRLNLQAASGPRELEVQHVVCGTGFEVDLERLPFLDKSLGGSLQRIERAPVLSRRFESSEAGLYFIGPSAAMSFGPLLRFVAGAAFAVPVVARHLARSRSRESEAAVKTPVGEPA
jgi:pyridine nucleotide-disulfide oxidoreductase